jgi:hypothetical protein
MESKALDIQRMSRNSAIQNPKNREPRNPNPTNTKHGAQEQKPRFERDGFSSSAGGLDQHFDIADEDGILPRLCVPNCPCRSFATLAPEVGRFLMGGKRRDAV